MDAVKEDMQVVGVRVEDTKNRLKWKTVIRCGDPWNGKSHKEKKKMLLLIAEDLALTIPMFEHFWGPYLRPSKCTCVRFMTQQNQWELQTPNKPLTTARTAPSSSIIHFLMQSYFLFLWTNLRRNWTKRFTQISVLVLLLIKAPQRFARWLQVCGKNFPPTSIWM